MSFQKRVPPEQWKPGGLARVSYTDTETVACSCGWRYAHPRERVREDAVDRHFTKRHNGRGIRL